MKRLQTIPTFFFAIVFALTLMLTGCNAGTLAGPDMGSESTVQVGTNTKHAEHNWGKNTKHAEHNWGKNTKHAEHNWGKNTKHAEHNWGT